MDVRDWELLTVLNETKNITHAADRLYLSQSTLSSRLKNLEQTYDVQLVLRKRRGITFTAEGMLLVEHAKKMLKEQEAISEKINNMKGTVSGTIKVGVSNFFALNKMPKLLRYFQQLHPNIESQVVTGWSSEMYRLLLNHDIHLAIIKGNYPWQESKSLLYEENICVASPWEFSMNNLPMMPRIDYDTDRQMKSLIDEWWYRHFKQKSYTNIYVNQVETCKEMILNGLGYGIVSELVVQPYEGLVVKTLGDLSGQSITRNTWLYYHTDTLQLNIVRAFVEFITNVDVKTM